MRKKVAKWLNKVYGLLMSISFFGGLLPLLPFAFAIIVGGELGEKIAVFIHKEYYPWVIALGSFSVILGLISMYLDKMEGLSVKRV